MLIERRPESGSRGPACDGGLGDEGVLGPIEGEPPEPGLPEPEPPDDDPDPPDEPPGQVGLFTITGRRYPFHEVPGK
jgi:hypothetical protein